MCSRDACVGVPRRARSATTPPATGRNQTWTDAGALVRRTKQLRRSGRQRSEPCRGAEPTRPRGRCRRRQRATPRTQRLLDRVRRGHVGCRRVGLATFSNRRRPRAGATARPSRRQDHCSTTRRALRVLGRRSAAPGSVCSSVMTGRSVDGSMCHPCRVVHLVEGTSSRRRLLAPRTGQTTEQAATRGNRHRQLEGDHHPAVSDTSAGGSSGIFGCGAIHLVGARCPPCR